MSLHRVAIPLCLACLLVACNRSASPETRVDGMATQLAASLTAAPTKPPTATLPPSATAVPPTPSDTPTPTETPTVGPSPTPTAPPLPADDPRQGLNISMPDYLDDFSQRFKWFAGYSDNTVELSFENGSLRATDKLADGFVIWSTSDRTGGDIYAEVSAHIDACAGKDAAGLALRIGGPQYDQGYSVEFACDGSYRVRKFFNVETGPGLIQDWTPADAIHHGPDTTNLIGFLAHGPRLAIFANGEMIGQWDDADYVFGTFGLYANSIETPGLTVIFDDFALWYILP
jgi:hypothetical protein